MSSKFGYFLAGVGLYLFVVFYGVWAFSNGQNSACRYLFGENYEFNLTECKVAE